MPRGHRTITPHVFRQIADANGQARIGWHGAFSGELFDVRVDQEMGRKTRHLALDIGEVKWPLAFAYAEEVGKHSLEHDVVMGYHTILDEEGSHAHVADPANPYPRGREVYYPSIMKSATVHRLNARMALVAATILKQAREIGLFAGGDTFGYHLRNGAIDQRKFHDNFREIVRSYGCLVPKK